MHDKAQIRAEQKAGRGLDDGGAWGASTSPHPRRPATKILDLPAPTAA